MTVWERLKRDIQAIKERDPALRSSWEILFAYPGFHAIQMHRIAHFLYKRRLYVLARLISAITRFFTGIDIHPGAQIGAGVFIDHGVGVVIGETAVVKDNVTLYQGVVLGGTGKERGKRHPTIEENVVVASGAQVLGSFTVGANSRIGAGAVVLQEIPPNSTAVGVPARVVRLNGKKVDPLCHDELPDPIGKCIAEFRAQIAELQERIARLEEEKRSLEGQNYGTDNHQSL
ncbi:MAG: serine O-acetyltransferase [Firmicutes bacterium]|jgi:serine O-acetyltransferase|nr:serine O-acetyltransferase [Bacillota bacterium]